MSQTLGTPSSCSSETVCLHACFVWSIGVLFYFYEFMLQTSTGVMVPDMMQAFQASAEQIGQLSACYLYTYAVMQIPVGLLMDRFGPRPLFTIAALFCAVGCFVFGQAEVLSMAAIGRMLTGIGASFAVVGCLKLAALWFPPKRFALLAGLMVAIGMMGAAGGQAPMALMVKILGWRDTMMVGAVLGLLLAVVMWVSMKSPKSKREVVSAPNHMGRVAALKMLILDKKTWNASIYAGLMFVPTVGFGGLWGVPFLMEAYQVDRPSAALLISLIYLGWAIGGPIFGWFSDHIQRRRLPMMVGTLGALSVMVGILMTPDIYVMALLLTLLGIFSSAFVLAFSVVRESHFAFLTGAAMGLINTLNSLSGALAQWGLGSLLDRVWTGEMVNGIPYYSLADYQTALQAIPVMLLIALLFLPLIKETHCQPVEEFKPAE